MRKDIVYTEVHPEYGGLVFFYKGRYATYFLFAMQYRSQVHNYFRDGKSVKQLYRNKKWHRIPPLANVIEGQLARQLKLVLKEDSYAG